MPGPRILGGMRNAARLLSALVIVSVLGTSCAHPGATCPEPAPAAPARRFSATTVAGGNQGAWMSAFNTVQGNSVDVVVFSTTSNGDSTRGMYPGLERVALRARFNQAVTIKYQTLNLGATTWRTLNGSGSGDSLGANTDYFTDFLKMGDDVRIVVTTGGTGPTTREVALRISNDRALGMFQ